MIYYEYELTTKQSIFLWLYQHIPNIDIIHIIYNYKYTLEYQDTLLYYGILPNNVIVPVSASEYNSFDIPLLPDLNHNYILTTFINSQMKLNLSFIKVLAKPGFICKFNFYPEEYDLIELTEICNGNWVSVIPNINEHPSLKDKLTCIHSIIENEPYFIETISRILNRYLNLFENNSIVRLGIDQHNTYYLPLF